MTREVPIPAESFPERNTPISDEDLCNFILRELLYQMEDEAVMIQDLRTALISYLSSHQPQVFVTHEVMTELFTQLTACLQKLEHRRLIRPVTTDAYTLTQLGCTEASVFIPPAETQLLS